MAMAATALTTLSSVAYALDTSVNTNMVVYWVRQSLLLSLHQRPCENEELMYFGWPRVKGRLNNDFRITVKTLQSISSRWLS